MAFQSPGDESTEGDVFDSIKVLYLISAGLTVMALLFDYYKNTDPKQTFWFNKVYAAREYAALRLRNKNTLQSKLGLNATPHELNLARIRQKIKGTEDEDGDAWRHYGLDQDSVSAKNIARR